MGLEIERKFLVNKQLWQPRGSGECLVQGYIAEQSQQMSVRVRIVNDRAWLNIKGRINDISRHEYEYEIPINDARQMLEHFAGSVIRKTRYKVDYEGYEWEVDVFADANAGLIVAEIELSDEHEQFAKPPWIEREVTDDPRYLNTSLAKQPYNEWSK